MQKKQWRFIDRAGWPAGPWDGEPDKQQWADPDTALPCLAVRNLGHWCGYVGIAEGHPLFGLSQDPRIDDLRVHGGISLHGTFCTEDRETGICHLPDPGEPDHVWWFGFDCCHGGDVSPSFASHDVTVFRLREVRANILNFSGLYRSLEYVEQQCAMLARQLQEMV